MLLAPSSAGRSRSPAAPTAIENADAGAILSETSTFHQMENSMSHRTHPSARVLGSLAVACAAALPGTALASFSLTSLGPESSGGTATAYGTSANGSVHAGWSTGPSGVRATRWSIGSAAAFLNPTNSYAFAVSGDGQSMVGYQGGSAPRAFRWTASGTSEELSLLSGGLGAAATNINSDGTVIVGHGLRSDGQNRAIRWVGDAALDIGLLSGSSGASQAWDVSADGSVVVGFSSTTSASQRAFRWTAAGGMVDLGSLGETSQARGVSDDGSTVVGFSTLASGAWRGFRWTAGAGMEDLGSLGGDTTIARSTNRDGSIVVGTSRLASGVDRAFIWSQPTGMVELSALLAANGVDLSGWTLQSALSISADGSTIVGSGLFNGQSRGFAAVIPAPGVLPLVAAAALLRRRRR